MHPLANEKLEKVFPFMFNYVLCCLKSRQANDELEPYEDGFEHASEASED